MPRSISLTLLAASAVAALAGGCTTTMGPVVAKLAWVQLLAADGSTRGTAMLISTDGKVELRVAAQDLPAGTHGMHLHAVGSCIPPDFASAGSHLNPHGKMHGIDNPQGSHVGDLPNLVVGADGTAKVSVTLGESQAMLEQEMFDGDGTALVIHAAADDYRTDPTGNSGGRIACGIITRG